MVCLLHKKFDLKQEKITALGAIDFAQFAQSDKSLR